MTKIVTLHPPRLAEYADMASQQLFGLNHAQWMAFRASALELYDGNAVLAALVMLSEAQDQLDADREAGARERIRHTLNRAKALLASQLSTLPKVEG